MKIKPKFDVNGLEISCRTCKKSDRDFILNLFKDTIFHQVSEYYDPSIEMFDDRFYSDYKERKILLRGLRRIGMFQISERNSRLAVRGLFLSKDYRGKGIAKHLMGYFEEVARKNRYSGIELSVWDNNPAEKFYEKLGYKIDSKKNHKYLMIKSLK